MQDNDLLAARFEEHRPQLRRIAYRMLGTLDESDDAVQEAWLRLNRTDSEAVDNLGGWLTTVVGKVCLDMLRSRTRRDEHAASWLPEPVVTMDGQDDPEQEALLADSVGIALLVVLETLSPAERLAFVLHDMFGVPFQEIAPIVDRSPDAARQLASRARRRVRGSSREPETDRAAQRHVIEAFLAAAREGNFERLLALLDPDVVYRLDAGPDSPLTEPPLKGATAVAERIHSTGDQFADLARPALVNGSPGLLIAVDGKPFAISSMVIIEGKIAEIDIVVDPEKLRRVSLS